MIAYHATPARNLPAIVAGGLRPDAPGGGGTNAPGVYLHPRESIAEFVAFLYREPVALLRVDLTGIPTTWGDDDDDIRVESTIPPARITVLVDASDLRGLAT